jgi:hypothetical protein
MLIDPSKLGPDGWKLLGGIEALQSAADTIKSIRERSTLVQERQFLAEIRDLLTDFAKIHQAKLAALAMENGAGELHQPTQGKPN